MTLHKSQTPVLLIAAVGLALCTSAWAETPNGPTPGLEEIVVTAQKRAEKILDVPASISVITGDQIAKLNPTSLVDFATLVPGLTVNSFGTPGQTQILLRGISTGGGASALVGTYIDDTPYGSSTRNAGGGAYHPDLLPYDIEQIEVLRGPQGTLYGASTMGGLLKYVLKSPDLEKFEAQAGSAIESTANTSRPNWSARSAVNLPLITDVLAVRISGSYQDNAGYIDNVGTKVQGDNANTVSAMRIVALWKPIDNLSIKGQSILQNINAEGNAVVNLNPTTYEPTYGRYDRYTGRQETYTAEERFESLTVNYDFGWAMLTSATGYAHQHVIAYEDQTYTFQSFYPPGYTSDFPDNQNFYKITQEVRLASPDNQRLQWMVGAFYTDEHNTDIQSVSVFNTSNTLVPPFGSLYYLFWPSVYKEKAEFADLTYKFTDQFDFTVGERYSHNNQIYSQDGSGTLNGGVSLASGTSSDGVTTWMASPRFHVTPDMMVYGRVATGYRPGGANASAPGSPSLPPYKSDTLINYEVGFKGSLLNSRLSLNADIFYIDWKNIQISVPNAEGVYLPGNGGTASSRGVEFETAYQATTGLRLGANFTYTNAHLDEDAPGIDGKAGDQLPGSPAWTAAVTTDYTKPIKENLSLEVGGDYRYRDWVLSGPASSSYNFPVPDQNIVDLYLGLTTGDTHVRLYARNALNNRSYNRLFDSYNPSSPSYVVVQPRTVGVSMDTKF